MISFRTNERGTVPRPPVLSDAEIAALLDQGAHRRKPNAGWKVLVPSHHVENNLPDQTVRRIVTAVATAFSLKPEDLAPDRSGPRLRRPMRQSIPRHVAIYLLRLAGASYAGAAAGVKMADHSTAIYAERRMIERLGEDRVLACRVRTIMDTLGLA